jgi:Uma2 family endonuclease
MTLGGPYSAILPNAELRSDPRRAYAMGMAQVVERYWTPDEVQALPNDGARHECVRGELLVTPSPAFRHQTGASLLFRALDALVVAAPEYLLRFGPADLRLEPGSLVQPDLFVFTREAAAATSQDWHGLTQLRLAVELLSPGSVRHDRGPKRELYQRADVEEYWIVDFEARVIERSLKESDVPVLERAILLWQLAPQRSTLTFDVAAFFAEILDDQRPIRG